MAQLHIFTDHHHQIRPLKRLKTTSTENISSCTNNILFSVPPHPLRIKPLGNAFFTTNSANNLRDTSIGIFSTLSDELIIQVLGYLDCESLISLGSTCKGLYAFCYFEELWKDLIISSSSKVQGGGNIKTWKGTWRETYLYHHHYHYWKNGKTKQNNLPPSPNSNSSSSITYVPNLYSDVLYRPFFCSQIELEKYTIRIPEQNLIPRFPDLTPKEFDLKWFDKPFILTSPVKSWSGFKNWSIDYLVSKYGNANFRAEAVDWSLKVYHEYMINNHDESPLYLFDKEFVEKTQMGNEYDIPFVFQEDFFEVLGDERPDRRWLILGPRGSGSTFHKDPNATSAWNAVIQGSKYWIMFPPTKEFSPPGVFVSQDQSEVTSPLSIAEWFIGFHKEARRTKGCIEGICGPGEVLYVPSGWWHLVVNLSGSLAITQNFVPKKHVSSVLFFLRDYSQSVSGFDERKVKDPYSLFISKMEEKYPDVLKEALIEMEKMDGKDLKRSAKWECLVEEAKSGCSFSFSFGLEESEDESL